MRRMLTVLIVILSSQLAHSQTLCENFPFNDIPLGDPGTPLAINYQVNGDRICIRVRVTGANEWLSMGIATTGSMINSPVSNAVVFNEADGQPQVYQLAGRSTQQVTVEAASTSITLVSSSRNNGALEMVYERALAATTATDVDISLTSDTTILYAYGTGWPISSHAPGTRGAVRLQFLEDRTPDGSGDGQQAVQQPDPFTTTLTLPIALGTIVLLCILGFFLRHTGLRTTNLGHALLQFRMGTPPRSKRGMFHSLSLDFFPAFLDLRWGEVNVVLIYILSNLVVVSNVYESFDGQTPETKLSIATGHLAAVNLMFLLMPISKWPIWEWAFGISVDRVIKYHRYLARLFLIAAVAHLVTSYDTCGLLFLEECKNQRVIPAYGLLAFVSFASMGLLAIEPVRRRLFEIFYFYHRFASIIGLVFSILHSETLSYLLIAPIIIYVIGFARRLRGYFNSGNISTAVVGRKGTAFFELATSNQTVKWSRSMAPGSFFWVCNPEVSKTQWHPYSAIAAPSGNTIGFAVKRPSKSSFTGRLIDTLNRTGSGGKVFLDGPYGQLSIKPRDYRVIIMVGGGIGITPLVSMMNQSKWSSEYKGVQCMILVWTVRSAEELLACDEYMFSSWANEDGSDGYISVQTPNDQTTPRDDSIKRNFYFYVSGASQSGSVTSQFGGQIKYTAGRPQYRDVMTRYKKTNTAVVACGPEPMVDDVQRIAAASDFDFHKEVFAW